jgi:hypothetical protein
MNDMWQTALVEPLEILGRQGLSVLPNLLAMALILSAGLLVAWGATLIVERGLRMVGVDRLCDRFGICAALLRSRVKSAPSHLVGQAVYWSVAVFVTIAALGALNLPPINQFAKSLLGYIPHFITAAVILAAGYLFSNFLSQAALIAAVNAGLPPARLIAACARGGVQLLAVAMALEQLGIAQHIVVVGFGITLGGVVLAAAIAFGLGAKDLTKQMLERKLLDRSDDRALDDLRHLGRRTS